MVTKVRERERAIELRRRGYSYADILKEVSVAKSSLSLWLKNLPLTDDERGVLRKRKERNITQGRVRAAAAKRMRRVVKDGFLLLEAKNEFEHKSADPFFHVGIALYWAEGAQKNPYFAFSNTDPDMIALMLTWIRTFLEVEDKEVGLRLYVHEPYAGENFEEYWAEKTGLPRTHFKKTMYKSAGVTHKARVTYRGCIRIELYSVRHIRRMKHWQRLLIEYYAKQG